MPHNVAILLSYDDTDIDECAAGEDNCSVNAICSDTVGGEDSFQCTCNTGYTGNGVNCTSEKVMHALLVFTCIFSTFTQILMNAVLTLTTVLNRQHVVIQRAVSSVHVILDTVEMASTAMVLSLYHSTHCCFLY